MASFIKKIEKINFGLLSPEDIRRMSVVSVEYPDTYGDDGFPIDRGLMDPRMGVIDPNLVCRTCGSKGGVCPGHFGRIELARPVIHVGFGDVIHKILRSTCNECGRALLTDEEIKDYVQKIIRLKDENESFNDIFKEIYNKANKEGEECPHCGAIQDKIILDKPVSIVQRINPLYEFKKVFFDKIYLDNVRIDEIGAIAREIVENKESYFQSNLLVDSNILNDLCEHLSDIYEIIDILDLDDDIDASYELTNTQLNNIFKSVIDNNYLVEEYKLTANEVRERLEKISNEDSFVLGVNPEVARPEWLVLTVLPVPPVTVRPSITIQSGERSEDDLTHKLVDVLRINQRLLENMEAGAPQLIVEDLWELLQYHVTTYFDNEAGGVPPARHRSGRPLITLMQRLKRHPGDKIHDKSRGRLRENLIGKRVNFSARTVISPDPNIRINEVGVPEIVAKEVTVPVYVNELNIDEMKTYIGNGPNVHPGAKYVIEGEIKRRVDETTKKFILEHLKPGTIIERHLKDGDIVLLNRQPSLHKLSVLAHEVKVLPLKTFTINPAICPPYNADFDGDEMNIHVLQNEEARAEAKSLMNVQDNILSPRFGGPIIGAIRDHISGLFLLTKNETTFTEEEALQIIRKARLKMPSLENRKWVFKKDDEFSRSSYIFKQKGELWTGKELFSLILPNDLNMSFFAGISNVSVFNHLESEVIIENGILVKGIIDEVAVGSTKGLLLNRIFRKYGPSRAKEFLENAISLSLSTIMKIGITNSINDYDIPKEAYGLIDNHLNEKLLEVENCIEEYKDKLLDSSTSNYLKNVFDNNVSQILNDARDNAGNIAEDYFKSSDKILPFSTLGMHSYVMAHTGQKSSVLNITQISACVGPQSVRGQSFFKFRGYENRILPHFKKHELNAKTMGFVKSSFLKGLDPVEFFMHAISGRDTMVDKSIRSSQSGYMQRRLIYAMQDVHTDENGMVKDAQGNVIQMLYGEDGVDPAKSDFGKAADLNALIDELRVENSKNSTDSLDDISFDKLSKKELKKLKIRSDYLSNKLKYTIKNYKNSIRELNSQLAQIGECNEKEDLEWIIHQLEITHRNLLSYMDNCNKLEDLDEVSEEIKDVDIDLRIIRDEFKQKVIELKHDKKIVYNNLLLTAEAILDNKLISFSELDSRLNALIDNADEISRHVDKKELENNLKNISDEFHGSFVNLKNNNKKLNARESYFDNVKQCIDEINFLNGFIGELSNISEEYFEERIIEQENICQNLLPINDRIRSENVENALDEIDKYFGRSMFRRQLKRYNLDDELDIVKNELKEDIVNQKITVDENTNLKGMIKKRCEEFRKNHSEADESEINNLLNNLKFSEVDEDIVSECKDKVKKDFLEDKITINQVELKLNNYINKKINESDQLNELEMIKKNPDVPSNKVHLTQEELNNIYVITKNEILSEYGISGNVESRVRFLVKEKIRENHSEARGRLNIIIREYSDSINLNTEQMAEFTNQIELYIHNHKIKHYEITEEYMIELSEDFRNNGKIILR